ncbi:hypothetical protein AVEN_75592-1 [Araneus ventricosus]|uniref:DUF19 domain-containing protein n=1 Tax=Araneus ventricosus TaxID=182803 RepID=A0A4Y2CLM7_ARAVE|nr:hypothetical protein AVEN_75592-1 [Araneus ventricosus]
MGPTWCLIAVLFVTVQGCLGTDGKPYFQTLCDGAEKCADYELGEKLRRVHFLPTTEEELNSFCPSLIRVIWCVVKECAGKWNFYETMSNQRTPEYALPAYKRSQLNLGGVMLEICTDGTELRQDYLSSITCFKTMFFDGKTNAQCQRNAYPTIQSLNLTVEGASETQRLRDTMCMSTFHALACLVAETKKTCGTVASNMVKDIFKKVELITWVDCNKTNMHILKSRFLNLHLLDKEREIIFSSFFDS